MQVDRKVLVWIGVLVGIVAVAFGGYLLLKPDPDARGTSDRVTDRPSGLRWDMYDEPMSREVEVDLDGEGPGAAVTAREYTVDHGGWIERVVVFDAGAGAIDYELAALATFGDEGDELGDVEYVKIAEEFDAAIGASSGTTRSGDEPQALDARVFAGQIAGYVVTGGIAVVEGEDPPIDLVAQTDELLASVRTPD